jgi:dipeptidyl aminopeptidase/acylaminoacyl peptidase
VQDPNTHDDIWIVDIDGDRKPKPFLNTEYGECNPTFSPDGRWLAYVSYESGQPEIYVREYTNGGHKEMVSSEGGINPVWSRDGRELYYISGESMMVVQITPEPDFRVSAPAQLFEGSYETGGNLGTHYDVSDDGRFLMIKRSGNAKLICVHSWFEELKRLAPTRQD